MATLFSASACNCQSFPACKICLPVHSNSFTRMDNKVCVCVCKMHWWYKINIENNYAQWIFFWFLTNDTSKLALYSRVEKQPDDQCFGYCTCRSGSEGSAHPNLLIIWPPRLSSISPRGYELCFFFLIWLQVVLHLLLHASVIHMSFFKTLSLFTPIWLRVHPTSIYLFH